jgi:hypothetical protein
MYKKRKGASKHTGSIQKKHQNRKKKGGKKREEKNPQNP